MLRSRKDSRRSLPVYTDASVAPEADDRRVVSGVAVLSAGAEIHCLTQKPNTWRSRTPSGKLGFGGVVHILQPLGAIEAVSVTFHEDGQGAIKLPENPLSSAPSKHVNVGYHDIRVNRAVGIIKYASCSSWGPAWGCFQ